MQPDQPGLLRRTGGSPPARPARATATTTSPIRGATRSSTAPNQPRAIASSRLSTSASITEPLPVRRQYVGLGAPSTQYRCRKRDSPPISRKPSVSAGSVSRSTRFSGGDVDHPVIGDHNQYGVPRQRSADLRRERVRRSKLLAPLPGLAALAVTGVVQLGVVHVDQRRLPLATREPGRVQPVLDGVRAAMRAPPERRRGQPGVLEARLAHVAGGNAGGRDPVEDGRGAAASGADRPARPTAARSAARRSRARSTCSRRCRAHPAAARYRGWSG